MGFDYTGKTAVITGGASGIGLEMARAFAACGASIAICDMNQAALDQTLEELRQKGARAFGMRCDVSSRTQMRAFADEIACVFGHCDIWINNAGVNRRFRIEEATEEWVDPILDVDLKGVIWGMQAAIRLMKKTGGVILNASSFNAQFPSVGSGVYSSAKAAVETLTKTVASEAAPYGIRVLAYAPGVIDTPMLRAHGSTKKYEIMNRRVALNRFGRPEEIASIVLFLASDDASFIDGVTIHADGGKFTTHDPSVAWEAAKTDSER